MSNGELIYKIGVVGPTMVGKTSLITAILTDCARLLGGRPLNLRAVGDKTEEVIARNQEALAGALLAGEFRPDSLRGTEEAFTFHLLLDPRVPGSGIRFDILDYPGGWLNPPRPPGKEEEWRRCHEFITESTVLLVPIDAAVLMETRQRAHTAAVPSILTTPVVANVAGVWAQERNQRPDEPALMLLCPLKCESYFADNGGHRDRSDELRKRIRATYDDVLTAVRQEATDVQLKVFCCPIDTIGCVEVQRAEWVPTGGQPEYRFVGQYRVRNPARRRVRGVDDLFGRLCEHLVEARRRVAEAERDVFESKFRVAEEYARRKEGFLRDLWHQISGERNRREELMLKADTTARDAARRVDALNAVIGELAARPLSARAFRL